MIRPALLILCLAISYYDISETYRSASVIIQCEGNPLQAYIMIKYGLNVAMTLRAISAVIATISIIWLSRHRPRISNVLLLVWTIQQIIVVYSIFDISYIRCEAYKLYGY